jgi:aspartyl-tRNA(Asn)/glutamyl-tRNA(Gln) amidotransferase subunit C
MISKQEVEHIAKLARLGLGDEEIEKFQEELSSILDYIEKMKEVDVSGIEPTSHPIKIENVMREDKESAFGSEEKLTDLAPDKKEGHIKVKSILK